MLRVVDPTFWLEKAVVNATLPPDDAVPETTRSALLLCVVDLVQPVGALVCANSISVPDGMGIATVPVDAEVTRPFESTVIVAKLYVPAETPEFARVELIAALADPSTDAEPVTSPVRDMVLAVVHFAALPVTLISQVPLAPAPVREGTLRLV